ncbi:hypothetical protein KEM55_008708 [Ascosphaera atra]|nr:hypothetical protein KEM55_008708 [Ascosphaera atra]
MSRFLMRLNLQMIDEAALIEERRKRREAILAKYRQQQQPEQQQSEQQQAEQPAQQPAQQQQDIPLPSTEVSQPSSVTEESKASDSAAQGLLFSTPVTRRVQCACRWRLG